jgi:hypothetical protein
MPAKLLTSGGGGVILQPASSIASDVTVNVPNRDCTLRATGESVITSGTAVTTTSGTAVDFTGIPSWVKRITVMFKGISLSGSSSFLIQLGSGSYTTTGYSGGGVRISASTPAGAGFTTGFAFNNSNAATIYSGHAVITNVSENIWCASGTLGGDATQLACVMGGNISLGGTLDRIRITTVNGTDTFDAGSINILYE